MNEIIDGWTAQQFNRCDRDYCWAKLPCGVCRLTHMPCTKPVPRVTYSTSTSGTKEEKEQQG